MSRSDKDALKEAVRIMGALVRMPPKPHDQMKLGKPRGKLSKKPARKRPGKRTGL